MSKKIYYLIFAFFVSAVLQLSPMWGDMIFDMVIKPITLFLYAGISFFYAKKMLLNEKQKWLLSVLCSLALTIPCAIMLWIIDITVLLALVVFAWCEIWLLLGLIRRRPKKNNHETDTYKIEWRKDSRNKKTLNMYWLWMPIVHLVLLVLGYFIVDILMEPFGNDLGIIVFAVAFLVFYVLVAVPLMSILYSKKIRTIGWKKYLCVIYNALVMGMYMPICYMPLSLKSFAYALISFPSLIVSVSALLCGIITLIVNDVRNSYKNQNAEAYSE